MVQYYYVNYWYYYVKGVIPFKQPHVIRRVPKPDHNVSHCLDPTDQLQSVGESVNKCLIPV